MGLRPLYIFHSFSAVIVFRRQNRTSIDVRFWRLKTIPALKRLKAHAIFDARRTLKHKKPFEQVMPEHGRRAHDMDVLRQNITLRQVGLYLGVLRFHMSGNYITPSLVITRVMWMSGGLVCSIIRLESKPGTVLSKRWLLSLDYGEFIDLHQPKSRNLGRKIEEH